jgi:hypothetical protein
VTSSRTTPVSDYSVLITNSSAGLNSIDSGIILANTGYYVYLVYNPETYSYGCVLSLSHDMPTFPTESTTGTQYRYYQRLGWIRTDANGDFYPSLQIGKEFLYYQKPPNVLDIAFTGGGTSVNVPLLDPYSKDSDKYPAPEYLITTDIYLNWTGTGFNRDDSNHRREFFFNEVPMYVLSTTASISSSYYPANFVFNDYILPIDKEINISVGHPDDTDGTESSHVGFALTGFRFNGDLYV